MARLTAVRIVALLLMVTAIGGPARGQVLCRSEADDVAALRSFDRAVNAYVEMHRRLDAGVMWISSDPEAIAAASKALAEAIQYERRDAAPGDLFQLEVADLFRLRLEAAHFGDLFALRRIPDGLGEEESAPCGSSPDVNSPLTRAASVAVGELVACTLPTLPAELEYRLAGRALLLVDVPANLVVDVLDDALP